MMRTLMKKAALLLLSLCLLTGLFSESTENLALPAFIRTFLASVVMGLCLVLFLTILPIGTHPGPVITASG